jgi:hypothetical protein
LQRARHLFPRSDLEEARAHFIGFKTRAYDVLEAATLDPEGRALAQQYLDAFYRQIESDDLFYRPVVTSGTSATIPRADANGASLCAQEVTIPAGTPVSAPLSTSGSWVQVRLLDVFWSWASSARCEALRRSPMWIEASHVASRP